MQENNCAWACNCNCLREHLKVKEGHLPLRTHPVIVVVEVLAVLYKDLNVSDEFSPEVWLKGHQFILHLCATGKQFFPGVPKCVHFVCFLFGNQQSIFM